MTENKIFFLNKRLELSLFSGKLNVSVFTVAALCLMLYADFSVYTLIILGCIAIHELAHIITLTVCGGTVKKINVYPFGIDMISDINTLSYTKELCVVLSGGMANLACALLFECVFGTSHSVGICFFIYANMLLGIGNLIPLPVFDGGRALHIVISKNVLPDRAYICEKWADIASYVLFFGFSLCLFFFTECNLSAVVCVGYTALAAVILEKLTTSRQSHRQ